MLTRLLTPRKLLIIYLTGISITLIYILSNKSPSCTSDYDTVDVNDRNQRLNARETELKHWESALRAAEKEIKLAQSRLDVADQSAVSRYLELEYAELPGIYVITPTYTRHTQKADLVRLVNTLTHVRRLHWVLVEDSDAKTSLVSDLLSLSGLHYTHLYVTTPSEDQRATDRPRWYRPRGVLQRNAGIRWIRANVVAGVVYFADDDNTYDLRLFEEMRDTRGVSVWPVGLVGHLRYERPIVSSEGRVTGWFTYWKPSRPFALDMAGFAVNFELLRINPAAEFSAMSRRGEMESDLLVQLVQMSDLEPKAGNCTKVLVWHTHTEPANVTNEEKLRRKGLPTSDLAIEV